VGWRLPRKRRGWHCAAPSCGPAFTHGQQAVGRHARLLCPVQPFLPPRPPAQVHSLHSAEMHGVQDSHTQARPQVLVSARPHCTLQAVDAGAPCSLALNFRVFFQLRFTSPPPPPAATPAPTRRACVKCAESRCGGWVISVALENHRLRGLEGCSCWSRSQLCQLRACKCAAVRRMWPSLLFSLLPLLPDSTPSTFCVPQPPPPDPGRQEDGLQAEHGIGCSIVVTVTLGTPGHSACPHPFSRRWRNWSSLNLCLPSFVLLFHAAA